MQKKSLRRYFGDKAFYKMLIAIVVPMILQNGLTNFVSLLDNIMVGALGTEQMSGISIVNQLLFVFSLCIFGGLSGAGIFTAQFHGKKDVEGVRHTFRFMFMLVLVLLAVGLGVFLLLGDRLIGSYLHDGSYEGDLSATAEYGAKYLRLMLWGLLPFAVQQAYSSTLRATGETILPMKAGIAAIVVNFVGNYLLIFGKFGFPALGVEGAAIATVISRYVECAIILMWTHTHKDKAPFITNAFKSLRVPGALVLQIAKKGMPLLINEFLWSAGMAMLTQCYSTRGLAVVAGLNICSTIANLFNVVWLSMGTAVSIVVGKDLGAGDFEEAENSCWRILVFSVLSAVGVGALMVAGSGLFPKLYNTTQEVRDIATGMLCMVALSGPVHAFNHASYFTLRSGGKTWITFLFDSAFLWAVSVPVARILSVHTVWHIVLVYGICQFLDILKCGLGYALLKKKVWINRIV